MQYSSGTRGYLEWTRDHLPWVYEEYGKRNIVNGGEGLQGFDYASSGSHYMEGGTMGPSGLGDVATDTGVTSYFGGPDDSTLPDASASAPASTDPAASAPAAPTTSGLSDIFSKLATAVGGFMLTKQQLDTQNKIVAVQLDRAQKGLPPININTLQAGLPQPTVRVGLAADTGKMVMYALLGLGAVFLLPQLLKRGGQ
jgi:hypothetical protein